MCSLLTTLGVLLLATAGNVTCADDFDFTCPEEWKDGAVESLVCTIPLNKLTSPVPCDPNAYSDTVDFYIIPGSGNPSCSVSDFDTTCNNTNVGDCVCQARNATHVTFVYNVTADKNLHENARWNCVPQCLDSNLVHAITARNTSQCFQTKFETTTTAMPTTTANPCSGYTCRHGTQENVPGCPCHCFCWWIGDRCDFWWPWILIGIAVFVVVVVMLFLLLGICFGKFECRCCCGCWMRFFYWKRLICCTSCNRDSFCICCIRNTCCKLSSCCVRLKCCSCCKDKLNDNEEGYCCVSRIRQHAGDDKSEPLNRMEPMKNGDLDGSTAAEQPKPAVSNSDHKRKN